MGFRGTLIRCVEGGYDRKDVHCLVKTSYHFAFTYLKMKASSHKSLFLRDEKLEDLAWDFIADLFQKDERGNLTTIQTHFHDDRLQKLSNDAALIELRKIVFSKVDDNVFRHYGERDPSLRKIIRNLKLAIRDCTCKNRVCYKDGLLIIDQDQKDTRPFMPVDFLRIRLCARLNETFQIPDVLIEVIEIISSQRDYSQSFNLVALAVIIRESYVIIQDGLNQKKNERPRATQNMLMNELEMALNKSAVKLKEKVGQKYVRKGRVQSDEMEAYFNAASETVMEEFHTGSSGHSQYDQFCKHNGDIDYDEYRERHRPVFEYIVKLIREDVVSTFRKDWARF
jgi:hypothetical protein